MALITCGKCGKKVSDTTERCIHCGAKIYIADQPQIEVPTITNEPEILIDTNLPIFSSLSEDMQIELENEFISKDNRAKRYRRTGEEAKKFGFIAFWLLFLARILLLLQSYVIAEIFEGKIYNPELIEWSKNSLYILVILWLAAFVMCVCSAAFFKNRLRKHIYIKKFQKWLKVEKNINYIPNLATEKDRILFNQIDLNTIDC